MNEQRKAFETYAAARWDDTTTFERDGDGYLHVGINNDWKAWQAAIAAQEPKQAMTDADIQRIGRNLQSIKSMQFRAMQGRPMTVSEREEYEATIAFARAILAASSPNKELVEALKELIECMECEVTTKHPALVEARAALRAAGVEAA